MILIHPPIKYPDGRTRSHAASDGSLYELHLFASKLAHAHPNETSLEADLLFVDHAGIPHYRVAANLFENALALGELNNNPNVRALPRDAMAALALTRPQIEATRVVNLNLEACDLRIDRSSPWGNPYRMNVHGNRHDVIQKHRRDLLENLEILDALKFLKGKSLGCHCKPNACHGDTYVDLIHATPIPQPNLF